MCVYVCVCVCVCVLMVTRAGMAQCAALYPAYLDSGLVAHMSHRGVKKVSSNQNCFSAA